jgi:hypothetical protein
VKKWKSCAKFPENYQREQICNELSFFAQMQRKNEAGMEANDVKTKCPRTDKEKKRMERRSRKSIKGRVRYGLLLLLTLG